MLNKEVISLFFKVKLLFSELFLQSLHFLLMSNSFYLQDRLMLIMLLRLFSDEEFSLLLKTHYLLLEVPLHLLTVLELCLQLDDDLGLLIVSIHRGLKPQDTRRGHSARVIVCGFLLLRGSVVSKEVETRQFELLLQRFANLLKRGHRLGLGGSLGGFRRRRLSHMLHNLGPSRRASGRLPQEDHVLHSVSDAGPAGRGRGRLLLGELIDPLYWLLHPRHIVSIC